MSAEASVPAASFGSVALVEIACPKCKRSCRAEERACPRCGLLSTYFQGFAAPDDPPPLDEKWREALAQWDDPRRHDQLIDLAANLGALPSLARRYRELREDNPEDAVAARRLSQIAAYTESALRAHAQSDRSPRSTRALWLLGYGFAAVVLLASAWVFLIAFRRAG